MALVPQFVGFSCLTQGLALILKYILLNRIAPVIKGGQQSCKSPAHYSAAFTFSACCGSPSSAVCGLFLLPFSYNKQFGIHISIYHISQYSVTCRAKNATWDAAGLDVLASFYVFYRVCLCFVDGLDVQSGPSHSASQPAIIDASQSDSNSDLNRSISLLPQWSCQRCTFNNHPAMTVCECCMLDRNAKATCMCNLFSLVPHFFGNLCYVVECVYHLVSHHWWSWDWGPWDWVDQPSHSPSGKTKLMVAIGQRR